MESQTNSKLNLVVVDFTLDRVGLDGIDGKTDKEVIIDWLKAAQTSAQNTDPLQHLLWRALYDKLEAADFPKVTLSRVEFIMIQFSIIRANFTAAGNNVYCQILNMFGLGI